jgi:hypothetical protein
MALVLIKEDGTGKPDANSYAAVADGDSYHDAHLYASTWTAAVTASKEKALVMATRLIDAWYQFNGFKRLSTQALQWPRRECRDPDNNSGVIPGLLLARGPYLDETKVPPTVVFATCEFARELLKADRTDDPEGEGITQLTVTGAVGIIFDKRDRQPVVPYVAQAMLAKLGTLLSPKGHTVRLVRA